MPLIAFVFLGVAGYPLEGDVKNAHAVAARGRLSPIKKSSLWVDLINNFCC